MSAGIKHYHAGLASAYTVGGTTDATNQTVFHLSTSASTFTDGWIELPAHSLKKGDLFHCFAVVDCPSTNSTDTLTLKAYIGPESAPKTGILVCDQAAIDVANDDEIALSFWIACEEVGAGSTARFSAGGLSWADAVTAVSKTNSKTTTDAQVDTAADNVIALTGTWSVSSASNSARLRSFHCIKYPAQISK